MPNSTKQCVFVIEEKSPVKEQLKKYLADDFNVTIIDVPTEAINKAAELRPDVILLNLEIPNIDGFEIIKLFKSHPSTLSIPIICMSEEDDLDRRVKAEQLGSNGFLSMPLEYANLKKDLKGFLQALNSNIQSANFDYSFHITYNDKEKETLIKKKILETIEKGSPVIVLSWQKGEDFFVGEEEIKGHLLENKIIFLEIQPSLIVKYPYLQDLSPLFSDIFDFIENDSSEYHLIFDEPRNLINVYDKKSALSKSFILANLLRQYFKHYSIFNTRPRNSDANIFQQKLAKVFIG